MKTDYLKLADDFEKETTENLKEQVLLLNEFTVDKSITGLDNNIMMGNVSSSHTRRIKIFTNQGKPSVTITSKGKGDTPDKIEILPSKKEAQKLVGGPKKLNNCIKFFIDNYDLIIKISDSILNLNSTEGKKLENEIKAEIQKRCIK